jgi:hypothetical protein
MMSSPFNFEVSVAYVRERYMREAEAYRLSGQLARPTRSGPRQQLAYRVRFRLATWLYALALRLSPGAPEPATNG